MTHGNPCLAGFRFAGVGLVFSPFFSHLIPGRPRNTESMPCLFFLRFNNKHTIPIPRKILFPNYPPVGQLLYSSAAFYGLFWVVA